MLARKLGVGIILGVVAKFSQLRRASISWLVSSTPNDFCRCSLGCSWRLLNLLICADVLSLLYFTLSVDCLALCSTTFPRRLKYSLVRMFDNFSRQSVRRSSNSKIRWCPWWMRRFIKLQPVLLTILKPSLHLTGRLNWRLFGKISVLLSVWLNIRCSLSLWMLMVFVSKSRAIFIMFKPWCWLIKRCIPFQ